MTDVPSAVHLSATRRAREGKYVGALGICARNFGAQLRRKSGQNHLLPHIQTPYLTSTSISSTFCRSRLGDGRGREPAPRRAADATNLAGGEREEAEKDGCEELLNEIGDITEEELKAAFSRAEMQLNDASSALLALLTQVPVRLPDTYIIHDNINAITDISEKNAAAFESLREAAAKARTMCAKLLGGEEYVQEIIENQTLDVVSRYAVEQKARNR